MLRFYARPGHVCPRPGTITGQKARYVGLTTKVDKDEAGNTVAISHPPTEQAFECAEDSEDGKRILKGLRSPIERANFGLWPADRETAARCGIPFVEVELRNGEWLPKAEAKADSSKKGSDK